MNAKPNDLSLFFEEFAEIDMIGADGGWLNPDGSGTEFRIRDGVREEWTVPAAEYQAMLRGLFGDWLVDAVMETAEIAEETDD